MIVYVVINEYERTKFEKLFQIPFGYGCTEYAKIFITEEKAWEYFNNINPIYVKDWIIEKITSGEREIIS